MNSAAYLLRDTGDLEKIYNTCNDDLVLIMLKTRVIPEDGEFWMCFAHESEQHHEFRTQSKS